MKHSRQPRRAASATWCVVALTAGIALAVGAPVWWSAAHQTPTVEAVDPGALHRLADAPAPPPLTAPTGADARSANPTSTIPISGVGGQLVATTPAERPVRIEIPSISVDAAVISEGVAADGQVAIPDDIHQAGWYRWGAAPGDTSGSTVIVGHLDSDTQPGLGAFAYLRTLTTGARIDITTTNHHVWHYQVVARQELVKTRLPLADIFSRTGRARLTLVTCGGNFNSASHSYDDNIVITAVPIPAPG